MVFIVWRRIFDLLSYLSVSGWSLTAVMVAGYTRTGSLKGSSVYSWEQMVMDISSQPGRRTETQTYKEADIVQREQICNAAED